MNYKPTNPFKALSQTPLGLDLWGFLTRCDSRIALRVASKLGRPAVAALGNDIYAVFGQNAAQNQTKQMMGEMVRQILEAENYTIKDQRVQIKDDPIFRTGTRYSPPQQLHCVL